MNRDSVSYEKSLTIVGEHVMDAITPPLQKGELEEGEDPSVIVEKDSIYFRDPTWIGVRHNNSLLAQYFLRAGSRLDRGRDKIEAAEMRRDGLAHIVLEAERVQAGGGGRNVAGVVLSLTKELPTTYIAIHPTGSPLPPMPEGLELRIQEVEYPGIPILANLVISKVLGYSGEELVSGRMIIKHPSPRLEIDVSLGVNPGVLLVDSVGNNQLVKAALAAYLHNKSCGKQTLGVAALTSKMQADVSQGLVSAGFVPLMNEAEACEHACRLSPHYRLTPFDNGSPNYAHLLLAAEVFQSVQRVSNSHPTPVFITLGKHGSMGVSEEGEVYLMGVCSPEKSPKGNLGAGDAYAAGVVLALMGGSKDLPEIMRYATAVARAAIDQNLERVGLELSKAPHPILLPHRLEEYTASIRVKPGGANGVNEEIRALSEGVLCRP